MSKALKVLSLDIYFKLPDDFEGNFNDALKEYIKYREENNLPDEPDGESLSDYNEMTVDEFEEMKWELFLDTIDKNKRDSGFRSLRSYDYDKREWVDI